LGALCRHQKPDTVVSIAKQSGRLLAAAYADPTGFKKRRLACNTKKRTTFVVRFYGLHKSCLGFDVIVALVSTLGTAANTATDSTVNTSTFTASIASSKTTGFAILATAGTDFSVKVVTVLLLVGCSSALAASFSSSHVNTSQGVRGLYNYSKKESTKFSHELGKPSYPFELCL
jgi:hypothetical protein